MRLNVKAIDESGKKVYHSYDFEGYKEFYVSTGLYDKTSKLIYGGDIVEYKNTLYEVCLGEFETEDGFRNIGWHLKPIDNDTSSLSLNSNMLYKIKVVDIDKSEDKDFNKTLEKINKSNINSIDDIVD